ncbi:hypothetical protein NEDG_02262 [Nematocida displodere]|uniref:Uncharacterized protein n=1 Tax=Nematocida displodere TaxID=1805483 RepID=A0A177EI07_9MICR|nr:hypothetical protein NEDG_02262 [Nematocida displodere]
MGPKTVRYFRKACKKLLGCQLTWLGVFCMAVGCADKVPVPGYITSPYTKQTIKFFKKSGSDGRVNRLEIVEIDGERRLLKKQTQSFTIALDKYTLKNIPKKLAQGIEFRTLAIESTAHFDPAVLEKILSAFGTINADKLELSNLAINKVTARTNPNTNTNDANIFQRCLQALWGMCRRVFELVFRLVNGVPPKCTVNVKDLGIYSTPNTSIEWLQERVDLPGSPIELVIHCMPDFGNLEVLDGFNAAEISRLDLFGIDELGSLDCKLLREGPLPDVLVLKSDKPVTLDIPEQIIRKIASNQWTGLGLSMCVWEELAKLCGQYNSPITADGLRVYLAPDCSLSFPVVKRNQISAGSLSIIFHNSQLLVTYQEITVALGWASRYFGGLGKLVILTEPDAVDEEDLIEHSYFVISSTPAIAHVWINDVVCSVYQRKKHQPRCSGSSNTSFY